jgi:glycosyltransferase involved in cell wall biosynthesis
VRILFIVQRYGAEVAGGSEAACRSVAERLAEFGHEVEVATSRARSYVDWADHYPEGATTINGVTVNRFSVRAPRVDRTFAPIHHRAMHDRRLPLHAETDWLRLQGPDLPDLLPWVRANAERFDVAVLFTYLYPTTALTLPAIAALLPTVIVPTAHDEPPMEMRVFDEPVRSADAMVCLTPEELEVLRRRFRFDPEVEVIGLGVDVHPVADASRFRAKYGLGELPYLLFLGRLDPGKGSDELYRYFVEFRRTHPHLLKLVIVGEPVSMPAPHPDVIITGFVDEQTKLDATAGAMLFVQPSYFESFSLALCEAWVVRVPALVQGHCEVLVGQARRSGGGIPYTSYAEFSAAVEHLFDDEPLRRQMGENGRQYVLDNYQWGDLNHRWERFLGSVIHRHSARQRTNTTVT